MQVIHDGVRRSGPLRARSGVAGCPAGNRRPDPFVTGTDAVVLGRPPRSCREEPTMGLLDRLFGRRSRPSSQDYGRQPYAGQPARASRGEQLPDDQAIARYRYLLRTAPPEQIEQAHTEAFSQLTVDQRQQVLAQLAAAVPAGGRPRAGRPRDRRGNARAPPTRGPWRARPPGPRCDSRGSWSGRSAGTARATGAVATA